MTLGLKTRGCCLALFVLTAPYARGDVLLDGSNPVDRGRGTFVGSEIHWVSCDGERKVVARPPYSFYKREGDCKGLGPMDLKAPQPDVFGLTCHKAEFVIDAESCKVTDEKLAQYFFKNVKAGDSVIYKKTNEGKISLSHGNDHIDIQTRKWRNIFDEPQ